MFNVNDRVRCTGFKDDPSNEYFVRVGDTGTVQAKRDKPNGKGEMLHVKWDNPNDTACNGVWWVDPNDCEPA